jgi:putative nucleotidyltransferase with HDIG domain
MLSKGMKEMAREPLGDAKYYLNRLSTIRDVPTMPAILIRLNRMLQDEDVSIDKIGQLIETDQAISSKILKLVNSAFFGFRSCVSSISHALMILGFNTVRNAAISVSLVDAIQIRRSRGFDVTEFWRHSIAVAVAAKYLAKQTRLKDPDNAFAAGLLHDVGKLVMLQFLPELFDCVWESICREGIPFHEAEQKHLPIDHAVIGAHIGRTWQFPPALVEAIAYHHKPPEIVEDIELVVTIHLADLAANHFHSGAPLQPDTVDRFPGQAIFVKEQIAGASHWFRELEDEIEAASSFFLQGTQS